MGSGLNQYVFLPSDPMELVDKLKLIVIEKVGGNDNPMLSEQIVAIADKHPEYEWITIKSTAKHAKHLRYAKRLWYYFSFH